MSEVYKTELPGVGIRYDFRSRHGDWLGVLVHRTGGRDLVVYSDEDPDRSAVTVRLDPDDAATLAEVLGGGRITEQLMGLHQNVAGLAMDWLVVESEADWAGRTLAEAAVHTNTGVSIVAIIRDSETFPAPGSATVLYPGDTVVAIGTVEGLAAATAHIQNP